MSGVVMRKVLEPVVDAIGNTPLVRLDRLTQAYGVKGTILARLDYLNPGFSQKDRAALGIIEEAERSGTLQPGQTVVELTSGNMGTGLAIVCGVRGYPFVAIMSKGNSEERARMMRALGAEVVLVDQLPTSIPVRYPQVTLNWSIKSRSRSRVSEAHSVPINLILVALFGSFPLPATHATEPSRSPCAASCRQTQSRAEPCRPPCAREPTRQCRLALQTHRCAER